MMLIQLINICWEDNKPIEMKIQLLEEEHRNIHNYDQLKVALNQDVTITFVYSFMKKCLKKF